MEPWYMKYKWYLAGGAAVLLLLLLTFCGSAQAQTPGDWPDDLNSWTEGNVIIFDQIDGTFEPRLTGSFSIFNDDKAFGWFFSENDATGPVFTWRAWWVRTGDFRWSAFLHGSTDLSDAKEAGMWNDALLGLEFGMYWNRMKNLAIRGGLLNARFVEGEPARITPYFKLAFRL
jgi:hypothetical protein